jgi:putative ABC transport system permease protein
MTLRFGFLNLVTNSIKKRPFRNIATILCFVVITGTLLTTYFLVGGAQKSVDVGMAFLGADILVLPKGSAMSGEASIMTGDPSTFVFKDPAADAVILTGKPTTLLFKDSIVNQIIQVEGVANAAPQLFVGTLAHRACCTGEMQVIGIDPAKDFTIQPWLETALGRPLMRGETVIGAGITAPIGSELMFYGTNFTVAGRLDPSGMGTDVSAFITLDDAYVMAEGSQQKAVIPLDIREGEISAVLIRLKPGADKDAVAATVKNTTPYTETITDNYLAKKVNSQLTSTTKVLFGITAAVTLVSFPFMALVSTMVANERRRELALLRAMGATKGFIFKVVIIEALIIAAIGGLAGVAISGFLLYLFEPLIIGILEIPFLWPPLGSILGNVTLIVLIAIGVGGAASLLPAINSSNLEPYDAIRRSEL